MDDIFFDLLPSYETHAAGQAAQPINGTYVGQCGAFRLELRVDLQDQNPQVLYQPLHLVSGDFFRNVGGGEWDYVYSFMIEHPYARWGVEEAIIVGTMTYFRNLELARDTDDAFARHVLRATIPLSAGGQAPMSATVEIIRWGTNRSTFACDRASDFLRTIDLEIDRISGTKLPQSFHSHDVIDRPSDLLPLDLDILRAYQRAGIDMRLISDAEVFAPVEAGSDLKWDEDELHHAMEHHFSQWRDEPQWKLYLLIATHYRLYPDHVVTGLMYDSAYRDPNDPAPRQGAAVFYSSMAALWSDLLPAEFDRNYLRTCVHELGHALNMLHSFDKGRPESLSWMNYPWRYPYGYDLPPGWDGTLAYWQNCSFDFDAEELCHLRHHPLLEVIPGGASFGAMGHDGAAPMALSPRMQESAPLALYVRTRPERYLFEFAEPVTIELKLKNQTDAPVLVPNMLSPELGLLELFIGDPKGQIRTYRPLFRLCGEARTMELSPGEKLYESVFIAYGAAGFYFEEPGEYKIWAVYGAGGLRLRSNMLRVRVAFPQSRDDEKIALWTFGREQGHVLYMRGAQHLQAGNDQLREVAERFPGTNLARYVHFCFGNSRAREFKDVVAGQVRPPQQRAAAQELEAARTFDLRRESHSALDNITHGRAVELLSDLYLQMDQPEEAKSVLTQTVRYFRRMNVKAKVIDGLRGQARVIGAR